VSQVRAFSRFTSVAVIVAIVAITVLMTCGAAFGAPMTGETMPGSSACPVGSHDSLGSAALSAESPTTTVALSAVLPTGVYLGVPRGIGSQSAAISAELPPPSDPRHGRIRV
jgi:hypothetical protein